MAATRSYRLGVLKGDGIGPEVVAAAEAVARAATTLEDLAVEWIPLPMGWDAIRTFGHPMPASTKDALAECDGWIMGPHDSVSYPPDQQVHRNPSGELRHHFDLYANIRPAATFPGVPAHVAQADLVVVRENTEEFYPDRNMFEGRGEWMPTPDIALSVGVFTRRAAERIAHVAFRLAQERRRHVSIVHKVNAIRLGTGLFLRVCREVAAAYPDVRVDDYLVDAMTAHLVRRPHDFDVIVTTNMFGDILSDLAAELTGSLGLAASINAGDAHAMAQATHGAAPDIAGRNIANPTAEILSTALLMDWLARRHDDARWSRAAERIRRATLGAIAGGARTPDLGGSLTTTAFTDAVLERLDG
ncbi:MAG: isocitrate/isopropylmalate dehydrogenase family protein [Actinomycetia bacterium]|nr:isocitrate/isopropylmalate dehydrogenase family protein [Actinomycetes bacterium]